MLGSISMVTIDDDPSLWPGHLQPFGTSQNFIKVEEAQHWPSPAEFFENFVDKSRPILFKGLAKRSPAFKLWDDDYLRGHPGSNKELVYIEPEKKENRTKKGKVVTFKEFIDIYHNSSVYMVNGCPKNVMKDVFMPPPLRCEETRKYLKDAVTWFSSGGTKSVVHYDDLDNVNCLFRGSKQLYFVNGDKYSDLFPWKDGGYSSIDVDKVDYVKYPELRLIHEYIKADMEAGDCLFIPFKWIHQVNSKANEQGQNVAVNIWFKHTHEHRPVNCVISEDDATIDKFRFSELEKNQADLNEENVKTKPSERYEGYLQFTRKGRFDLKMFIKLLKNDETLVAEDLENTDIPEERFKMHAKKLFKSLDFTNNNIFNYKDLDAVEDSEKEEEYEERIEKAETGLLNFLESFLKKEERKDGKEVEGEEEVEKVAEKKILDEL